MLLGKQESPSTGYSPRATLHRSRRLRGVESWPETLPKRERELILEQERREQPREKEKGRVQRGKERQRERRTVEKPNSSMSTFNSAMSFEGVFHGKMGEMRSNKDRDT